MENEYSKLANAMAMREQGYRSTAENTANMAGPMQSIAAKTGAPSQIDPSEIASIAGLANIKAVSNEQSTQRETAMNRQAKRMPSYVKAYRNYLQWRYPTRYGGGGGGGGALSSYTVPSLPPIAAPPQAK
jgi:hypothetical protein